MDSIRSRMSCFLQRSWEMHIMKYVHNAAIFAPQWTYFLMYFFYLRDREGDKNSHPLVRFLPREREREGGFHHWFSAPDGCCGQGWARPKPEAGILFGSTLCWQQASHLDHLLLLSRAHEQRAGLKVNLNWCSDMGCVHCRQGLNPLHYGAVLVSLINRLHFQLYICFIDMGS